MIGDFRGNFALLSSSITVTSLPFFPRSDSGRILKTYADHFLNASLANSNSGKTTGLSHGNDEPDWVVAYYPGWPHYLLGYFRYLAWLLHPAGLSCGLLMATGYLFEGFELLR
ncbi:hypothetical protein KFK09_007729 [Dendrobium nobile]|uniref:Uncharacterized protein n=1 Tax=Dendrobium nobile TaxID=94219 RepID=A0A8T3BSP7_DENNO|nr:hypothetical protein KFK09_007729 [Dendrobium nobile]